MTRFVTVLLTLFALGAIATLTTPAYAQYTQCSSSYLSGFSPYAIYWQGFTKSGAGQVPWAGTGELWFTGEGTTKASLHASINGVPKVYNATGTYTVASDCTGTLTLTPINGATFTATFLAPEGGFDLLGTDTTSGDTMMFSAFSVELFDFAECSNSYLTEASPEVVYFQGFTNSGGKQVPWSGTGQMSFSIDGSLTASLSESVNGVPQTVNTSGTYKVALNCTGTMTLTSVNGHKFSAAFVAPFGGEDIQGVDTTSGDTMAFSAFPFEEEIIVWDAENVAAAKAHARKH